MTGVNRDSGPAEDGELAGRPTRPSSAQVLATLDRILASEGFVASAQLSRFLAHLVGSSLKGETTQLKESVIGLAVFNRGPGYDPKVDPIVRVEARRLRARLESYYQTERAADEVRISLPKGGYAPVFEWSASACTVECGEGHTIGAPAALPEPVPAETRWGGWQWELRILALATCLAAIGWAVYRTSSRASVVSGFWSSILDADKPALVIPADSGLVMLENLTHQTVQLPEYLSGEYLSRLAGKGRLDPAIVLSLGSRRYTSIVDLELTNRLSHRREAARFGLVTRFARDVRVADLKGNNLVLVGSRESNPWVELFEKDVSLRMIHDELTGDVTILNNRPAPGERKEMVISWADLKREIYGIVTYHRYRDGGGKVLLLAGTSVAGTEAAVDFLLNDARLAPWLTRASVHNEIRGFDVLLHGRNLSGSAPRADVESFHVDP
jgi:hypothetical protein